MAHTCNYYCVAARHCIEILTTPGRPLSDIQAQLRQRYGAMGWTLLDVRPAPEADVEQWRVQKTNWDQLPSPEQTAAYLAFVHFRVDGSTREVERGV